MSYQLSEGDRAELHKAQQLVNSARAEAAEERNALIRTLLAEGHRVDDIAEALPLHRTQVYRIINEGKLNDQTSQ